MYQKNVVEINDLEIKIEIENNNDFEAEKTKS